MKLPEELLEHVPAALYVADTGVPRKWIYVSPGITALLGFTPGECIAEPDLWFRQVHQEDRNKAGDPCNNEFRMYTRSGEEIWVRNQGTVLNARYYGCLLNITEEKRAEEKLRKMQKQQEQERLAIEQRIRGIQKFEAIGRLAAGVAHDFNNLLMAITSYCDLLKLELKDPVPAELEKIQQAAMDGSILTRHLLAFGGKQIQDQRSIDLNHVIKDMEPLINRLAGDDIHVETILAENLGSIKADPTQIEDIIVNLTMTARESMPTGGTLLIETANVQLDTSVTEKHASMKPGAYVQLSISDSGLGLDRDAQEHIFEPFYTRTDHTVVGGLKLPAVYGSVKQNSGFIWVYSEPDRGTTFRIYFPRIDAAAEKTREQKATQSSRPGQTVLVVDDNEAVRIAISAFLEMNGFRVLQASGGNDALTIAFAEDQIDLLITDLVMPQMGGLELSEQLAARHPNMKMLFMSGYTEESVIRQGTLKEGAAFLQKPATMQVLLTKIRDLLAF